VDAAGQAVAGAIVELHEPSSRPALEAESLELKHRTETDAAGAFDISTRGRGGLLLARKTGLAPAWMQPPRWQGAQPSLVLTSPTTLSGVVVDERDQPVGGVEVFVAYALSERSTDGGRRTYNYLFGGVAAECFSARTGADGRFRIEGFPPNASASLAARAPGKTLRQALGQSLQPDAMPHQAGQDDIRLVVEPAGSIEGKIVGEEATALLPVARLVLQPDGPGVAGLAQHSPTWSNTDGTFRLVDVPVGSYRLRAVFGTNALPDWVAESAPVMVESGQATRDIEMTAIRGGVLAVTVLSKDERQPLAQVSVNAYREGSQTAAVSGDDGLAVLRLPPGGYQLAIYREYLSSENTSVTVEVGQTNRLEFELAGPVRLAGVVRQPDGQAAAGLTVQLVGGFVPGETGSKTDAEGRFEVTWSPQQFGGGDRTVCVLIRDPERNLAAAQDVDEGSGPLELRLEPALTLVGRAECEGQPVTNATAALVFWTGNRGMHLPGLDTPASRPGQFEIRALPPGRRYGLYVSAPGYGRQTLQTIAAAQAERVELDPVELKLANLELSGQVLDADDQPVAGAHVHLSGEGQPNANARSDRAGRFTFAQVCAGMARLFANARNAHGSVSAEGGDTNVVIRLGESSMVSAGSTQRKLQGVVTDPDGQPVARAQVAVFPFSESRRATDESGAFNLTVTIQEWQLQSGGDPCLVVRHPERNLAAAEDLPAETTNVTMQLKPAVTLTGRVEGPDGAPLPNAEIGVWLLACRTYSQLDPSLASTDARGQFAIKTLPHGPKYIVFAKAKDHGREQQEFETDPEANQAELPPFVLKVADQVVAGQVVDEKDKPVSGVHVSLSGGSQPDGSATTDRQGRFSFKVCEGSVRLFASGQNSYGSLTAEGGDTNVVLQLGQYESSMRPASRRASLRAKPLPELASVGLAAEAAPAGKPLLLCLFDAEQRPSRRVLGLLSDRHAALVQRGIAVAAAQTVVTAAAGFQEWREANSPPFPVGRVAEATAQAKWATDVESLPWLILTDAAGEVVAEGFAFEDLDAKLETVTAK